MAARKPAAKGRGMARKLENATQADLDLLIDAQLGVTVHTDARGNRLRGPVTPEELTQLKNGQRVRGVSAPVLWDEISGDPPEPTGRKKLQLDDDVAATLEDDAEVTRLGLDPVRIASMRLRMLAGI